MELKKNPTSDIEITKDTLLLLGFVLAFSLSLIMFGWVSVEQQKNLLIEKSASLKDEELFDVIVETPPPPARPPAPAPVLENIEIKKNEEVVEETKINTESMEEAPDLSLNSFDDSDTIYEVVEESPSFPGGMDRFYRLLAASLKYTTMAKNLGIQGRVFLQFVVEKDGRITDIVVLKGLGAGLDENAVEALKSLPNWTPGKQQGIPVRVKYTLPIKFTLQN